MGKLPTEEIAKNIAGHAYTVDGKMKTNRKAPASPRVQEMLELSKAIKESF